MSLTIITDVKPGESCLLTEATIRSPLILISDTTGARILFKPSPVDGWSHDKILDACSGINTSNEVVDAFLGDTWIGSTEV